VTPRASSTIGDGPPFRGPAIRGKSPSRVRKRSRSPRPSRHGQRTWGNSCFSSSRPSWLRFAGPWSHLAGASSKGHEEWPPFQGAGRLVRSRETRLNRARNASDARGGSARRSRRRSDRPGGPRRPSRRRDRDSGR
jgi:hypothetical protein